MSGEVSTVLVTYPDEGTSRAICRSLIERRLAACANIFAVSSMYRWNGKIEEASEFASLIKIRSADFQAVVEAVKELHPYEVPCIVRYGVTEGSSDYLDWVRKSTAQPPEDRAPNEVQGS
jgi:periplasmic divalent cation tolerance protein